VIRLAITSLFIQPKTLSKPECLLLSEIHGDQVSRVDFVELHRHFGHLSFVTATSTYIRISLSVSVCTMYVSVHTCKIHIHVGISIVLDLFIQRLHVTCIY